jgi:hypothetical protein
MRGVLHRVRVGLAALRAFAAGFLGLAAPLPVDADAARRHLHGRSEQRPPCC